MNTTEKGNQLEKSLYKYLIDEINNDSFVYGIYPPHLCKIHRQKKYFCNERKNFITFDVVLEIYRPDSDDAHTHVVFECKNHDCPIQENQVVDFSDKLDRIFRHNAKGVLVVSKKLQSGAENLARSRKLGIVKFQSDGLEIVAERAGIPFVNRNEISSQFFHNQKYSKTLKFSAFFGNNFSSDLYSFLISLDDGISIDKKINPDASFLIPYISKLDLEAYSVDLLNSIKYKDGPVDLDSACSWLNVKKRKIDSFSYTSDGKNLLGSANFDQSEITIYKNYSDHQERFTLAHEIGHFFLQHQRYLKSECAVEDDFFVRREPKIFQAIQRLEFQANVFAGHLLLPSTVFFNKTNTFRDELDIKDRGHGYIYVDDQNCNLIPYNELLSKLSNYFQASKQSIRIKLLEKGWLVENFATTASNELYKKIGAPVQRRYSPDTASL
ncbi:MAG: ImmA/IrrE family metallo-endopeptidase [Rhodospirillaceae bacterium]